jgi:hypothetical protein
MEFGMAEYYDKPSFEFEKDVDLDIDNNIDFTAATTLTIAKDVDVDISVDTNIEGNTAILVADVQAIGTDTFVQVDTSVITVENALSSVSISIISAVG